MEREEIIERLSRGDTSVVVEAIKMLKEDEEFIKGLINESNAYKALYRGLDREIKRREKKNGTK